MKILKTFLMAAMMLLTLNVTTNAANLNEIVSDYYSEGDVVVLTLEIPDAGVNVEIELLQSTFDAPVTIELEGNGLIIIEIDGLTGLIRSDGINARSGITSDGINALIRSDGINARSIDGDGINALIRGDGINALITSDGINAVVSQSGTVLFSENF